MGYIALTCIHWIQTYIERDVRQLKNIANFRSSSLSLTQDCGTSHTTMRQWLNILEASYLHFTNKQVYDLLVSLEKEYYLKGALFDCFGDFQEAPQSGITYTFGVTERDTK